MYVNRCFVQPSQLVSELVKLEIADSGRGQLFLIGFVCSVMKYLIPVVAGFVCTREFMSAWIEWE